MKRPLAIAAATAVFALGMASSASAAVVRSDPGIDPNPENLWGDIQCQADSRYEHHVTGGPDGGPWRQLTVLDGDNFFGERCELGRNTKRYGRSSTTDHRGTFYLFRKGDRRIIDWDFKLMSGFPVTTQNSTIFQLKHTCPCDSITSNPAVQLMPKLPNLYLRVPSNDTDTSEWDRWSTRVQTGVWYHATLDITFHTTEADGRVQLTIDDVDGVADARSSPTLSLSTINRDDGVPSPDHLRMGHYRNTAIAGTSSVGLADVQVRTGETGADQDGDPDATDTCLPLLDLFDDILPLDSPIDEVCLLAHALTAQP
ncbi:MAG: heparin lyase I family protein [Solirubrobacterales bacterium]